MSYILNSEQEILLKKLEMFKQRQVINATSFPSMFSFAKLIYDINSISNVLFATSLP